LARTSLQQSPKKLLLTSIQQRERSPHLSISLQQKESLMELEFQTQHRNLLVFQDKPQRFWKQHHQKRRENNVKKQIEGGEINHSMQLKL
jgi:hypothetical protein